MRLAASTLLAALGAGALAGCLAHGDPPAEATFRIGGTFTEGATQAEMEKLGAEARRLGGDMALLESFPVQFRASGMEDAACEEFRAFAEAQPYVDVLGECLDEAA